MIQKLSSALFVVLFLAAALPTEAQTRRRPARGAGTAATLQGFVVDAGDSKPVFEAIVTINRKTYRADTDGKYLIENLAPGPATVSFSRWGYESREQTINLVTGTNSLDVRLTSKPAITLVDNKGNSYQLDYATAGIASRGALSGYTLIDPVDFCLGNGEIKEVPKDRIATIRRSSNAFDRTKCCPDGAGAVVTVTLKGGETFDGLVRDCIYYAVDFIGRDRKDGKSVYVIMSEVESVTFPN